jgi:hypothetical protein
LLTTANFPALLLLLGFVVVVALIDFLITGAIAKWALFAPIFVPLMITLAVSPEAVFAAYRVADSPINTITPLNAYFALVVGFAQKYDKSAGVGTVVAINVALRRDDVRLLDSAVGGLAVLRVALGTVRRIPNHASFTVLGRKGCRPDTRQRTGPTRRAS